jgi:alpha-tubulin suppressor-like RCC1 family protein
MLDSSESASCWGYAGQGQLGDPTMLQTNSAAPVPIPGLPAPVNVVGVSFSNACAAMGAGGGVYCWGKNDYGGAGVVLDGGAAPIPVTEDPFFTGTTLTALAADLADETLCGLDPDGNVYCWGANASDQLGHADAAGEGDCRLSYLGACDPMPIRVAGLP